MTDSQKPILLAQIGAPHGIRGEVRVTPFGDATMLNQYGPLQTGDGIKFKIKVMRPQKNILVVKFEGVNSREQASKLAGKQLYVDRSKLPDLDQSDEYYLSDLIGLTVRSIAGEDLGIIKDIPNFGADDVLEIQPPSGKNPQSYFVPFTKQVVPRIDFEEGVVLVDLPKEVSERDEDQIVE